MKRLYKFTDNIEAVRSMLAGHIKFTPIAELNDPSELMPTVNRDDIEKSLLQLREIGYTDEDLEYLQKQGALLQRLAPQFQAISVPETREEATSLIRSRFYNNITFLEQQLAAAAKEISSRVGLFCLTKRFDSLPMWAHYANNAAGFVVELADIHDIFKGDLTGVLVKPTAVRYERERRGVTFDPRSHLSLFFSKFSDWKYEREVRIILPLDDCERVSLDKNTLYLFQIPKEAISRVIMGWRIPREIAQSFARTLRSINDDVDISMSKVEHGKVTCANEAECSVI
jgi:hypothetical protein